ncbi:para-aminobenzoic acid synthetase [Lenzites betulinus]|nr:para-aminobenzoic acid synthetase [Lenzites betulinus]
MFSSHEAYINPLHSLAALCRRAIPGCFVHIIKNDELPTASLVPLLQHFDAVIIGPGPGSPDNPEDIGVVRDVWHVADEYLLPVFGVCLGLQSLGVEHGAAIKRLRVVKHGQLSEIKHQGTDLFQDIGVVHAVRYHSLHIELSGQADLEPLAWADDEEKDGRVVMALKHTRKPFWAVQYHPESVCTETGGLDVLRNFWQLARRWSSAHGRTTLSWTASLEDLVGPCWPSAGVRSEATFGDSLELSTVTVATRTLPLPCADIPRICEMLNVEADSSDFVLLDSAAAPGRFAIIGCLTPTSSRITHFIGDLFVRICRGNDVTFAELGSQDIWAWLTRYMRRRRAHGGTPDVPFWGGLVGYLSYELGVRTLTPISPPSTKHGRHPDVNLIFVERSIVLDMSRQTAYVQTIIPSDTEWLEEMTCRLEKGLAIPAPPTPLPSSPLPAPVITLPDRGEYISKIVAAKEWLFSGDSYELCVTAPTRIRAPKSPWAVARGTSSSWELYKTLRARNPAPHSAYIRLHPSTLLSSSPERFLSYSRTPENLCQLRPIKGTVRKAPGITRAVAEEMLAGSKKEVAENLMIFCAVEEYETVFQLVSVIEGRPAPTVKSKTHSDLGWEVLRASLPPGSMTGAPKKRSVEILRDLEGEERSIYSGVLGYADVGGGGDWAVIIRSCFKHDDTSAADPEYGVRHETRSSTPNSVPGALYDLSGRLGAMHGAVPQEPVLNADTLYDQWTLGAGGAITALSDPVAEWDEMVTKVESVLRAFN